MTRRRDRRAALPDRRHDRERDRPRPAHPRAQPGLADAPSETLLESVESGSRGLGQSGPDPGRDQPTAGLGRLPSADRHRHRRREPHRVVVPSRRARRRRRSRPRCPASSSPSGCGARRTSRPLIRTYSLSGPPGAAEYRISVKREPHGAGSTYLHDEVRVGQTIECAAPRGTFTLRPGRQPGRPRVGRGRRHAHARDAARAGDGAIGARAVWWLQSARNRAEHAFADESRGLLASLPGAHAEFCYSQPGADDRPRRGLHDPGAPVGRHARTTRDPAGRRRLPLRTGRLHGPAHGRAGRPRDRSGPHLHRAVRRPRRDHSRRRDGRRRVAPHARPDRQAPGRPCRSPAATSPSTGAPDTTALLELAEACAVPVQWSCRTGVCHTCETAAALRIGRLLAGTRRPARRGQRARLLLTTTRRSRPRPLSRDGRTAASAVPR